MYNVILVKVIGIGEKIVYTVSNRYAIDNSSGGLTAAIVARPVAFFVMRTKHVLLIKVSEIGRLSCLFILESMYRHDDFTTVSCTSRWSCDDYDKRKTKLKKKKKHRNITLPNLFRHSATIRLKEIFNGNGC